jgi:hypothetical protein
MKTEYQNQHEMIFPSNSKKCFGNGARCIVCKLDEIMRTKTDGKNFTTVQLKKGSRGARCMKNMAYCSCQGKKVPMHATHHDSTINSCQKLFTEIPSFKNKSCFEIFHHQRCKGLWHVKSNYEDHTDGSRIQTSRKLIVNQKHELYKHLLSLYGKENKRKGTKAKQKSSNQSNAADETQEKENNDDESNSDSDSISDN